MKANNFLSFEDQKQSLEAVELAYNHIRECAHGESVPRLCDVLSKDRDAENVVVRRAMMWYLHSLGYTSIKAGLMMGGKDHATVLHSLKVFKKKANYKGSHRGRMNVSMWYNRIMGILPLRGGHEERMKRIQHLERRATFYKNMLVETEKNIQALRESMHV